MPPVAMFVSRKRPSGFEFAACEECNRTTSAADLVASFFARLDRSYSGDKTLILEAQQRRDKVAQLAPGVLEELFRQDKASTIWRPEHGLVAKPFFKINVDGPTTKAYLTVFGAKLGMALYRQHVGHALPLHGGVHVNWYLNAGLAQSTAEGLLQKLPGLGWLRQGSFEVREQFAYRYNCDDRSVVAALAGFHSNLHIFVIATCTPDLFGMPFSVPHSDFVQPGHLCSRFPRKVRPVQSKAVSIAGL
jgi:hypothetical protein